MKSPEMGIGAPKQNTPENNTKFKVQIQYEKPSYYNDGSGYLIITPEEGKQIKFYLESQYLEQTTIDKIQELFEKRKRNY